jgi:hypothetical protein
MKRSSDMDAEGERKLPWFIDPIEGRLKIERNALLREALRKRWFWLSRGFFSSGRRQAIIDASDVGAIRDMKAEFA